MLGRYGAAIAVVALCGCTNENTGRQHSLAQSPPEDDAKMTQTRLTYEDSCRRLQKLRLLEPGELPPLPRTMPSCDDEVLGVSFFRTLVADEALENLTLPRTFFGRSEIRGTSFKNTDMSESRLCWNDFMYVDFTATKLTGSDLRASVYENVKFVGADLQNADLRRGTFRECDFTDANLRGAKLNKGAKILESMTPDQRAAIDYQPEGEEPPGG
jgi:BTB/POZ domain-containing protein KCTD9